MFLASAFFESIGKFWVEQASKIIATLVVVLVAVLLVFIVRFITKKFIKKQEGRRKHAITLAKMLLSVFVQALHYSAEDLEFSRHRRGQQRFRVPLEKRDEVCLNLDIRQLGLGGASCGPKPMDKYIFPVQREEWTLNIEPTGGER